MDVETGLRAGQCHCGAVRFDVALSDGLRSIRRCTCSYCRMRGAVVAMAAMRDLDLPHDKVNVHGGACALGHPIGASGARIIVTLLGALRAKDKERGIATLCIGGGEATAVAIERMA